MGAASAHQGLTVHVLFGKKSSKLADADPSERLARLVVAEHAADEARPHALVEERDRRGRRDERRQRRQEFLDESRLVRRQESKLDAIATRLVCVTNVTSGSSKGTYQLDDLDQHPVVLRRRQDLKQRRGQGQIVHRILACELGQDVDRGRNDAWQYANAQRNSVSGSRDRPPLSSAQAHPGRRRADAP
jgi:hypothetical protein